jgi:uncharacterized protein (DUF1330 family)
MARGYVYAEVDITGPEQYEKYRELAPASIATFGGKYLIWRGDPETLEGDRHPKLVVMLEFESRERAEEWYNSTRYQHAVRQGAAKVELILLSRLRAVAPSPHLPPTILTTAADERMMAATARPAQITPVDSAWRYVETGVIPDGITLRQETPATA